MSREDFGNLKEKNQIRERKGKCGGEDQEAMGNSRNFRAAAKLEGKIELKE